VDKITSPLTGFGVTGVAIQSDGKIVASSFQLEEGLIVARFNTNGTLDTSFGSGGSAVTTIFGDIIFPPQPGALVIQPDGKILLACLGLLRYNANGRLDTTFGNGGAAETAERPVALALQADGKILVAGGVVVPASRATTRMALSTPPSASRGPPALRRRYRPLPFKATETLWGVEASPRCSPRPGLR